MFGGFLCFFHIYSHVTAFCGSTSPGSGTSGAPYHGGREKGGGTKTVEQAPVLWVER